MNKWCQPKYGEGEKTPLEYLVVIVVPKQMNRFNEFSEANHFKLFPYALQEMAHLYNEMWVKDATRVGSRRTEGRQNLPWEK